MFNLFKMPNDTSSKSSNGWVDISTTKETPKAVSPLNNKEYHVDIAEIHKSFASAINKMRADKEQATKTASTPPSDNERIKALEEMGFLVNPTVVKHKEEKINYKKGLELIENFENKLTWAEHYMLKYPNYKFITHDIVLDICKKYGLVIADAGKFKSEIPESNIDDMIKFKKEFNQDDACIRLKNRTYDRDGLHSYKFDNPASNDQRNAIIKNQQHIKNINNIKSRVFKYEDCSICLDGNVGRMFGYFQNNHSRSCFDFVGVKGGIRMVANPQMFKIEPWEEFNMKTHKLVINQKKWLELDPIMLMPVYTDLKVEEEGYLIITAWGDEASDPDVINEKMN